MIKKEIKSAITWATLGVVTGMGIFFAHRYYTKNDTAITFPLICGDEKTGLECPEGSDCISYNGGDPQCYQLCDFVAGPPLEDDCPKGQVCHRVVSGPSEDSLDGPGICVSIQ